MKRSACTPCDPKAVEEFDYSGLDPVFSKLSKPAQRALITNGPLTPAKLAKQTLKQVLDLHGIGPGSVPALKKALRTKGLSFKQMK